MRPITGLLFVSIIEFTVSSTTNRPSAVAASTVTSLAVSECAVTPNVKVHVNSASVTRRTAASAAECCGLCLAPACITWSYGWPTTRTFSHSAASNTAPVESGLRGNSPSKRDKQPGETSGSLMAPQTGCHLSPDPPLNRTVEAGFFFGTVPAPPRPPPPPPTPPVPGAGSRPHIVLLIADDVGSANLGFMRAAAGSGAEAPEVSTPHLDQLVAEGVRLARHYVYQVCSPTRCSLQSGRLPVHVNTGNTDPSWYNPSDPMSGFAGIPRNMTGIATKLKQAGYRTVQVGKWDAGMATPDHTPHGRGYDWSLGYFHHDNDYWTERLWSTYNDSGFSVECNATYVDFWRTVNGTGSGAIGMNGTAPISSDEARVPAGNNGSVSNYEEWIFGQYAVEMIKIQPEGVPLFLNYDLHIAHEPIEVPREYFDRQIALTNASGVSDYTFRRTTYQGMIKFMDDVVSNLTLALKEKNMYNNTLYVFSSDNGGPSFTGSHHLAANNWPYRGSKATDLEGGIRVAAFISGGFLQRINPALAGTVQRGLIHGADWYSTLCTLAGVDPHDARAEAAGLSPVDSIDQWPLLSGATSVPPRAEVHISAHTFIRGDLKLIVGSVASACYSGPLYPNGTTAVQPKFGPMGSPCDTTLDCRSGCLFDVTQDPYEHVNLAGNSSYASVLAELQGALAQANRGNFAPDRGNFSKLSCKAAAGFGGFWGPFLH